MEANISAVLLKKLIAATKDFTDDISTRPACAYIKLDFFPKSEETPARVKAVATDLFTVSIEWETCYEVDEEFSVLVKPSIVKNIVDCEDVVISAEKKNVVIVAGNTKLVTRPPSASEFLDVDAAVPKNEAKHKVGFRGKYLAKAIRAASVEDRVVRPVILEIHEPLEPIVMRKKNALGTDNIKLILPVRIK